jgi:hypothetical protein
VIGPLVGLVVTADSGPVSRDAARAEAERELSKGAYHADDPGLLERVWDRIVDWLDRTLDRAADYAPGGPLGLILIVTALGVLIWFALWRAGPLRRGTRRRGPLLSGADAALTARQRRQRAEEMMLAGRHADAIREWMRASALDLEERGVLDPRPGRTADEVAQEGAAQVPEVGAALRTAAGIFDEVWYGGRQATPESAAAVRDADGAVRQASLAVVR